jgi:hypothetical protein
VARFTRLLVTGLSISFLASCNALNTMNTVTLRNTSHFPDYELSAGLIDICGAELIRSNKRTGGEVMTVWENASDEELVMLWLWHNGEVREIYRLAPKTTTQASLLEGMGIAVISEACARCLYNQVITDQSTSRTVGHFE